MEAVTLQRGRGRRATTVLHETGLVVHAGEVVGISGPSGSGKTSLIRALAGEISPVSGRIELHAGKCVGDPVRVRTQQPGSLGVVAQDPVATLDALWSIGRSIAEPLRTAGIPSATARARARASLEKVGLGRLGLSRRPSEISIGQAQRVCIARALIGNPALVLADEPTSSLDVTSAAEVVSLLRGAADSGAAVIIVSHDRRRLDAVSDRRLHLDGGRLEAAR